MFRITGYYEREYEIYAYQVIDNDTGRCTRLKSGSVEDLIVSGLIENAKVVSTDKGKLIVIDNMEEVKKLRGNQFRATKILKKNGEAVGVEIKNNKSDETIKVTISRAWELIRDGNIENASVGMRNGKKTIVIDAE